ncbi:MAG TPA: hydrogenase maturation protease [Terracidiphilus sp.]|nr:hydrogenase maturation protease [Terracidiphilus sp.]
MSPARCLILACGNTLRGDDGVGPWLAEWAERRFAGQAGVRVVARQQWTPDLAEDIARAESVLFIDCSLDSAPGSVNLAPVVPAPAGRGHSTHHLDAPELLALARELYDSLPRNAHLLTIGAASIELGEAFSPAVTDALPQTCRLIEETVLHLLSEPGCA